MKKKLLIIGLALLAMTQSAHAYWFSDVSPSGHTLFYSVVTGGVKVCPENNSIPYYTTPLVGDLIIPSTVQYNGHTYSVIEIDGQAFYNCTGLTSVTLPSSITKIQGSAFYNCSGMTNAIYTGTLTQWCNIWFVSASSNPAWASHHLTIEGDSGSLHLVIPDSVTTIRDHTFNYCENLISVEMGSSVTSIGWGAFTGCTGLNHVTIGPNVATIAHVAFGGCPELADIVSLADTAPTLLADGVFQNMPRDISVHIPCGSIDSYFNEWTYFYNFIEESEYEITCTSDNTEQGEAYVTNPPTCQEPTATIYALAASGFRFDHWSDGDTFNPRSLTLTSDTTLTAYFTEASTDTVIIHDTIYIRDTIYEPNGIDRIDAVMAKVYAADGQIVVTSPDGNPLPEVLLYDAAGRRLEAQAAGRMPAYRFTVPATGVYLVKVGKHPARKVAVIR